MSQSRFLLKYESDGRNPMVKRDCAHSKRRGIEYDSLFLSYYIELNLEREISCEEIEDSVKYSFPVGECVYNHFTPGSTQSERGNQSRKTEHMVAVEVCEENMTEA
jgi:hypothetical protein